MSDKPEKEKEAADTTEDVKEEPQATDEATDEASAETQQDSSAAEDTPETPAEEPAAAEKKSAVTPDKPLEKMTVKELREMAKDIPGLTGVHAMKKEELLSGIKEAKGIKDEPVKRAASSTRELKLKIKALKAERQAALEAKDKKKATIFRRRISRLKKKTRRAVA
jgi:hypothetical protein